MGVAVFMHDLKTILCITLGMNKYMSLWHTELKLYSSTLCKVLYIEMNSYAA